MIIVKIYTFHFNIKMILSLYSNIIKYLNHVKAYIILLLNVIINIKNE